MAFSFTRFLDHTQRHTTVGRTPLDEWLVRCRDLYLTIHNTHNRQTSMPPGGFEPTISAGELPHALDRAATGSALKHTMIINIIVIDLFVRNLCNGRAGFVNYAWSSRIFAWEAVDAVTHCWMFPSLCSRDFVFLSVGYTNRGAAQLCPIACYEVVYVLTLTQPLTRIDFLRTCAKNISQFLNIYVSETHFDTRQNRWWLRCQTFCVFCSLVTVFVMSLWTH
jgi:hypothetical protein